MEENRLLFVFEKDTPLSALVHHSAPFTGCVDCIIPAGAKAYLAGKMNAIDHYIDLLASSLPDGWMASVINKAASESPAPHRFHGGLSFFASITTLLSDSVRFLPSEGDKEKYIKTLQKEYQQAKKLALFEETDEQFKKWVEMGASHYQLSEETRRELLEDGAKQDNV